MRFQPRQKLTAAQLNALADEAAAARAAAAANAAALADKAPLDQTWAIGSVSGLRAELDAAAAAAAFAPEGAGAAVRPVRDKLRDLPVSPEDYRSPLDADDTNSIRRAVATGRPVRCAGRTYNVSGMVTVDAAATGGADALSLAGEPGKTVFKRAAQAAGSAFFLISCAKVHLFGIEFDMNSPAVAADAWGVLVRNLAVPQRVHVRRCAFRSNAGVLGSGLAHVGAAPVVVGWFDISDNDFDGTSWTALYLASVGNGTAADNRFDDNAGTSLACTSSGAATATNFSLDVTLRGNRVRRTGKGIQVGGIASPYVFGNPAAVRCRVVDNQVQDAASYAVICQGDYIDTLHNKVSQSSPAVSVFGGINYLGRHGEIRGNEVVFSGAPWGIDIGGSIAVNIVDNHVVMDAGAAINPGATVDTSVRGNHIEVSGTATAVTVHDVEGDGKGGIFPGITSNLAVEDNRIVMDGANSRGIGLWDNAGGRSGSAPTSIRRNRFTGRNGASDFYAVTYFAGGNALRLGDNTWNGLDTVFLNPNANGDLIVNNVWDRVSTFAGAPAEIRAVLPPLVATYGAGGSVLWILPTAFGSGYTSQTTITVTGSGGGSGWAGKALINQGRIIGVKTEQVGSGYSGAITVTATDPGGGTGAAFAATTVPTIPTGRKLVLSSTSQGAHVLRTGGGFVGVRSGNGVQPVLFGAFTDVPLAFVGNWWNASGEPKATYAVGSLPAPTANMAGALAYVTGSATGKWLARCTGTGWTWPDGTAVAS